MPPDGPTPRPALPAAVSALVAGLVGGPPTPATVVAAHRFALYLSVRGRVLPLVTSDAVALPTALRLAASSRDLAARADGSWGVTPGDVVTVGQGRVVLPGFEVVAARSWRPARVRRHTSHPSRRECGSGGPGDHFRTHGEDVRLEMEPATGSGTGAERASESGTEAEGAWLVDGIRAACSPPRPPHGECGTGGPGDHFRTHGEAVAGLVGRGPGLTPSGDDALAGALLVAHALGAATHLALAVRARLHATTAVSAALLDAAADGYAARPVVSLVDAAVAGDADAVSRALPDVLAIGHTSGHDTVTGIRAALDTLTTRRECGSGRQDNHFRTHREKNDERSAA